MSALFGPAMAQTLEAVVEQARAGDRPAFGRLLEEHLDRTYAMAYTILGNEVDARGTTQAAFLRAWRGMRRLRDPGRFDAWLTRILLDCCRTSVARRSRLTVLEISPDASDADTPVSHDGRASTDAIERAFDRLQVGQRTILVLRHLGHRSGAEIAAILGISSRAATSRMSAAHAALERALEVEVPMKVREAITDLQLESMLARRAARPSAAGLRGSIAVGVAAAPQGRRPLLRAPRWLTTPRIAGRRAWVVITTGLLVALVAAAAAITMMLLRGTDIPRRPSDLVATGLRTLNGQAVELSNLVADPAGTTWAYGNGTLSRLDDDARATRSWTVADDPAFAGAAIVAPAQRGGVWLRAPDAALRWFDGQRFRDVVPAPPGELRALAEAPDTTLVAGSTTGVYRWNGESWAAFPDGRPAAGVTAVAIDAGGWVWVGTGGAEWPYGDGVSVFDGTRWTTYDWQSSAYFVLRGAATAILPLPDGTVWVATSLGVARLENGAWTTYGKADVGFGAATALAAGQDGSVWVATATDGSLAGAAPDVPPDFGAGPVRVARFAGDAWSRFGAWSGLPAPDSTGSWRVGLVVANGAVELGTATGIFRLAGERWDRVPSAQVDQPHALRAVLAISRDEAWAADEAGIWHWRGDAWSLDADLGTARTSPWFWAGGLMGHASIARMPDGTIVAATDRGLAVRRASGWKVIREQGPVELGIDSLGTVWGLWQRDGGPNRVGSVVVDSPAADPEWFTSPTEWTTTLTVGPDGTVWAAVEGYVSRLGADGRWVRFPFDPGRSDAVRDVADLAVGPDGDLWAVVGSVWAHESVVGQPTVLRLRGSTWLDVGAAPGAPAFSNGAIAVTADGLVWLATDRGLFRFDGTSWTVTGGGLAFGPAISIAPDGTVFVAGPSGVQRVDPGP